MSAQDKQIKITVGLDEQSFAMAKRRISELTTQMEALATASTKAGGLFGGGGGGPVSIGNSTQQIGTSGRASAQHRATAGVGGVADSLTKAVQNSASLFKGAANGSKDAFKIMSDGLKEHVRTSGQGITTLQNKLEGLAKTYEKVKSRAEGAGGGRLSAAAMGQARGEYFETASQIDRKQRERDKSIKAQGDLEAAANPTFYQRAKNFMGFGGSGAGTGGASGGGGMMNGALQAMGLPRWAGPVGALTAGLAAGSALAGAGRANEVANTQYGIDAPFFRLNAAATLGGVYGGNGQAIRHGDMARAFAMHQLAKDPAMDSILGNDKLLQSRRAFATPTTLGGMMAKDGFVSGGWGAIKNKVGGWIGSALGIGEGSGAGGSDGAAAGAKIGTTDVNQLARARMTNDEIALKATQYQQALEAKMQVDPGFNDRINSFYSGANSNAALLRMGGLGGGNVNFHGTQVEQTGLIKARAAGQLRDASELMGARAELAATAGRGFIGHGESILGAKTGGLSNVASLLATGAQFNGGGWDGGPGKGKKRLPGGASGFLAGIQKMIGTGGMDVTAASQLSSFGAGLMSDGSFTGGGGGFMSTLLGAGTTGSAGGDMRAAREVSGGVSDLGRVANGGLDPLQGALNASAAMKANGGRAPYAATWSMMHSTPADQAEFMKTGTVPPSMMALGVTKDMMASYVASQRGSLFARVDSSMMAGTDAGAAVARFKAAGGVGYMKGWDKKRQEKEIADLGTGAAMAGVASNAGRGAGAIRFLMAAQGVTAGGKGHGAHDTIKKNTTMTKAGGAAATSEFQDAAHNADDSGLMGDTFDNAYKDRNASERARRESQGGLKPGGDSNDAIQAVSAALTAFVSALKRESGGGRPGGKAGAPK